jgi:monoamine oxidase
LVQVSRRFWEDSGANGFARTDDPAEVWHATWDQPGPRGILTSYLKQKTARRVAQLDRQRQQEFVINQLGRVHPGLQDYAENIVTMIWSKDPWAKGAYFLARLEQMAELFPHVATPEGRVFFAGEHTSSWPSWMQGALQSGLRAAREVNDAV